MAGLGRKVFNSGDILLASEVQGYLQDQAVMVFDDSATRATAIGTANFSEGMASYLKDTDQVEVYDGSVWNSVGGDSGLIHIKTVDTGGNVTSISVDDCFSADYTNYKIIVDLIGTGAITSLDMRLRVSGTDNSASNYNRQKIDANDSSVTASRNASVTGWGTAPGRVSSTEKNMAILEIANPFQTTFTTALNLRMDSVSGSIVGAINYFGTTVTTSYTGFSIIPASDQINGKITVLGYKI